LTESVVADLAVLAIPVETPEETLQRKEMFAAITSIEDHDPRIGPYFESALDGATTRGQIGNDIGMEASQVSVVRKLAQRHLLADDDEGLFADYVEKKR